MPGVKHAKFTDTLERSSAFSFRVLEGRLGTHYAKTFVHNLKKKGRVTVLMKGWYSFRNSPYLITIPLGEAYIGLGSAASLHNAWDQATNIDLLTTKAPRSIKSGERLLAGRKLIIRRLAPAMYFGFELIFIEDARSWIRVSDPEKTIIDLVYYSYPFTDEIIPHLAEMADREKLASYLKRMEGARGFAKVRKVIKRLGLLA